MNKILVPTDFSEDSINGLDIAIKIAEITESEIYLINTIDPPTSGSFSATGDVFQKGDEEAALYMAQLTRANRIRLQKLVDTHATADISITPAIVTENLQEGVTNFIARHNIDLIVMGTSGQRTFSEYFVGNNTEQIIRISDCPVLAVRKSTPDFKVENIVMATDLDTKALEGITHIKKFASNFQAALHVLHVITSEEDSPAEVYSNLESFAGRHHLANYSLNMVHNSDEEEGIMQFAREKNADLIAVITHGRTGLANLVLGSVTEELVKEANIPVISVNMDD